MPTLSSLPARARALALSLTCPRTVRTNRDTGLIRLLACLFMLVDHAGKMLFPDIPEMRLIGRLAFPMFAYGVAVGAVYTRNPMRYLSRMVLLMLISQPLYALGLGVALRLGRNAAIGAGAAGMLLAFFSVGGLAHGLMTGELTGALATPLSWVPLAWPARLGSLGVEAFIDAARAAGPLLTTALAGLVLTLATAAVLIAWFCRFEDGRADA